MASGVFGLRKVYKKQVQNVTDNNLASWPESNSFGYLIGGEIPAASSHINKLDFSTDSITFISSVLPSTISRHSALSSDLYGYYAGGLAPTYSNVISRLDFSNETISLPGNNLASAKVNLAATSSDSYGYFGGGYSVPPTVYYCNIDRLDISNETVSNPGNLVPGAGKRYMATVESASHGYFAGGSTSPIVCTISRIDFTSETLTDLANGLPTTRSTASGVSNQSYGYIVGGYSPVAPGITCTISRLDFTSETSTDLANGLPTATEVSSISSSSSFGYHMGGQIPTIVPTIFRLDFSNETISNPGNGLPIATSRAAAVSGGTSVARGLGYKTYGYYGGGYRGGPSIYESRIERIEFSTETDSIMPSQLIYQHSSCNTVSSNNHGYFVGGFVPNPTFPNQSSKVQRFDFISEVVTELPSQASYEISGSGTLSNAQYGYIGGGLRGPGGSLTSNVIRLDFSSNSFSQPSSILTESRSVLNGVSDIRNNLGYFGGGFSSCRVCRIDLSSETITQHSDTLNRDTNSARSCQSSDYGYWAGGKYTPNQPPPSSQVWGSSQKIAFSTGTIQNGNTLYTAKYDQGVSQDDYYAWYTAGMAPPFTYTSDVQRLDFNTETFSNPANPLGISRASSPGGLSN